MVYIVSQSQTYSPFNNIENQNQFFLVDTSEDNELFDLQEKEDVKEPETARATTAFDASLAGMSTIHQNYPSVITRYICPETETEKVLLAATVPAGAQNLKVELHEDGVGVSIKYSWPKLMYNTNDLFRKKLQTQGYHAYHPMILSFKNSLENVRKKIDVAPDGLMKFILPVKVQTGIGSWEKWGAKRDDGSHVLMAAFSCYVKDYVKKVSDESVVYD